ncbi:MAG: hypothetical protein CFE45_29090, partial [Burkholderiales bacterium PBB5]
MPLFRCLLALLALTLLPIAPALAQVITVYSSGPVAVGTSRQLTAYVPLKNPAVRWAVNGVPGGNASLGTVSSTGLYTAPLLVPTANAVQVSATNIAQPKIVGTATLTVTQVQAHLWSAWPRSVPAGPFTLTLNGNGFNANAVVRFGGV